MSPRRIAEKTLGRVACIGGAMLLAGAGGLATGAWGALWAVAAGVVLLWAASVDLDPKPPRKRMSQIGMASPLQQSSRRAMGRFTSA